MDHKWSENNERLEHLNKIRKEDKNDDQEETKDRDKVPTVKDIVEKFCDRFEEIRRKPEGKCIRILYLIIGPWLILFSYEVAVFAHYQHDIRFLLFCAKT